MSPTVVEGPYLRDILDQPRALAETQRRLEMTPGLEAVRERLAGGAFTRVVLTGMGGSFHGLWPLHLRLLEQGRASSMVETSELVHYQRALLGRETLLVVVSQSGRSAEVVRLLEEAPRGAVIAVTNTRASPLSTRADATVLTHAGEEATVSCKTWVSAQMALRWLAAVLGGEDGEALRPALAGAAGAVERYLADWPRHVEDLARELSEVRSLFVVGRGPSLAAAGTGGLILKESTHRAAEGMSSAAFRHGPMEMLGPAVFVLVYGGPERTRALNERLVADVRAAGGRACLAAEDAEEPALRLPLSEPLRPILELLPVEMMTLALAALDGREAGRFTIAGKVTATE
ncbi:MAG TPA: SIS domain-containing protein [Vicinamibacteria bacterium]|nr:SIS domain-containing protein [Vicinamibacteria bacterium]